MFQKHARLFLLIAYSVCDGTSANNEIIQDLNNNARTRVSSYYDHSWWQKWGVGVVVEERGVCDLLFSFPRLLHRFISTLTDN